MANVVVKDNKTYYRINCFKCGAELLFSMTDEKRRVYGACKNCMTDFEVEVPEIKKGFCPSCQTKLLNVDKFCPNCGLLILKQEESKPKVEDKPKEEAKAPINKPEGSGNLKEKFTPEENRVFRKYLMPPFLLMMSCALLSMFMMLGAVLVFTSIAFVLITVGTIWMAIAKMKVKDYPKVYKSANILVIVGVVGAILFLGLMIWGITLIA